MIVVLVCMIWCRPESLLDSISQVDCVRTYVALVTLAALYGCKGEAGNLRTTAESLCAHDQGGKFDLTAMPPQLLTSIRQEDLDHLNKKPAGLDAGVETVPKKAAGGPATCIARTVSIRDTAATVTLTRKGGDGSVADYTIPFVKVDGAWRADYHLPEQEAVKAEAIGLIREAMTLTKHFELDKAKEKFVEAQKLRPGDPQLKIEELLTTIDGMIAKRVAGWWSKESEKDPMTDKENVYLLLPATDDISTGYSSVRPTLTARCVKGSPDLAVLVQTVVESNIYSESKAQYRFDSESAQPVMMTIASDRHGLFFHEPSKWFDRVVAHASGRLVLEVPLFGRSPVAVTFNLAGADKAIPIVKAACSH